MGSREVRELPKFVEAVREERKINQEVAHVREVREGLGWEDVIAGQGNEGLPPQR